MNIQRLLRSMSIAGGLLVALVPAAHALDKVTLSLNWIPGGNHIGFYMAQERGFYRDEGLDVEIQRGYGSGDTVKRVATGAAQIGIADSASVLIGRGNGLKVKQIGALFSRSADAIFFIDGGPIKKPKDLEGHTLAGATGETTLSLFPTFASKAGFDASKVKIINMAAPAKPSSLASKTVDAIVGFVNEEPTFQGAVEKAGLKLNKFKFSDYGIDYYSIGLIASDDFLAKHLDIAKRVLRATMKGYVAAFKDPQAGVAAFTKALPEANPAIALQQFNIAKGLILTATAKETGLGWIDGKKMAETISLIKSYQKVDPSITPNDIYTMDAFSKVVP